ncbi:GGDEF domain-containing protein [Lottiidibacillus patelloidae]|uniref:GGDEF domain-containing protein n=1 Tax=Lottiidibacillus patelloidae TaxID=2670334 RepID=A0A263BSA7_9BACI|nr:bifunctional diguanylate cyclase/phosphodiesterase [Lottiidibacillus patelloidae]OZM56600.1 GGDEF domain-containing protein [Lottiidibacillus patelloidae]
MCKSKINKIASLDLKVEPIEDNYDNFTDDNIGEQENLVFYKMMFETMVQHAPVSMYILQEGTYSYVNKHFCDMVGYTQEELHSGTVTFEQLVHPEDLHLVQKSITSRMENKETTARYRIRAFKKEGSLIYVEIHATKTFINDKYASVGTVFDVTEEVTTQMRLKENRERFNSLFYNNPDAIFTFDLEGNFTDANPSCEDVSGYSLNELLEMSFTPLILSEDLPSAIKYFEEATKGITNTYDLSITRKDGILARLNVTSFPMRIDGKIVGAYGIAKDITKKFEFEKTMNELAFYDQLTKLPNRKLFEDRLQQLIEQSREKESCYAVLFLDLDRFKFINDSLGHQLGDEFLKIVSDRISNTLRQKDTVGRFAGDEFCILIPDTNEKEVVLLAERINQLLAEPFTIMGNSISVSASIGIAFNNKHNDNNADELIRNADTAMYYTKKYGKNNYTVYSRELDTNTAYKLSIERDLKTAIHQEQFTLHYQPIKSIKTGELSAMEALIRWNHPVHGLIPPDHFIPVSEESGQIVSIGKWVLRESCKQNKLWQDLGHRPFKIAVNISTIQLKHQNFVFIVKEILNETGLDPKWLELEVTESILMEDNEILKGVLIELKDIGVSISIDDFGTGYTSLSYLRQFSFDRVKIDRSFIKDISHDLNGKAITSTIISLAHKLKMGVIAEGIEDEIQLAFLKEEDCDEGQGYYFSRPLPAEMHKIP